MNFRSGVAMRAVVDDPELLALAGVAPYRVSRRGWMLGFMLAGLAGVLLARRRLHGLNIDTLTLLVVNGYAAAVVGRLRSLPWTFVGGIALGLADAYATGYLPGHIPRRWVEQIAPSSPPSSCSSRCSSCERPAAAIGRNPVHLPPKVANARQSLVGSGLLVVAVAVISGRRRRLHPRTISQGIRARDRGAVTRAAHRLRRPGLALQYTFLGVGAFTMGKVAGGAAPGWGSSPRSGSAPPSACSSHCPRSGCAPLPGAATLAFGEAMYYGFFSNSSIFPGYGGSIISCGRRSLCAGQRQPPDGDRAP